MKKKTKNPFFVLFVLLISLPSLAQGINGYAAVTGVSGTTITINNVNESDDSFEDGEYIIIMQMQDNVIGNTTNTSSFGVLGSIQSAGLYEIREVISHTESGSVPNTITISAGLSNTYNINANASVQIITYPSFGSPNYTTTANMSPPAWNGTVGGVLAMNVPGILTLVHNIDADEDGFRGGGDDNGSSTGGCEDNIYISANTTRALKGEGIYKNTNTAYEAAKGKMLNGGGGGASHNGGGGGGGNYTVGGAGGVGWGCSGSATLTAGGQGGIALSAQINASRFFMGGGGGAGERNNNYLTHGGEGGGIIIIQADEITSTGTCGGLTISANGETTPDIFNDGAGAAGAGGSIFLSVNTFSIASGCALTVEASGGDGGSALHSGIHGGGGGGGQGVVIYSIAEPTTNITTITNIGTGGCANNSSPCVSIAGGGGGTPGTGIVPSGGGGPLPISLARFDVYSDNKKSVVLEWETESEQNNDYFIVDRSRNGQEWEFFSEVKGSGNSIKRILYQELDLTPYSGTNYYRLTQVDFDGTYTDLGIRSATVNEQNNNQFIVYPNPGKNIIHIKNSSGELVRYLTIKNMLGQTISIKPYWVNGATQVDLSDQPKGIYLLTVKGFNGTLETIKLILE